jgi:hypothetical protein
MAIRYGIVMLILLAHGGEITLARLCKNSGFELGSYCSPLPFLDGNTMQTLFGCPDPTK